MDIKQVKGIFPARKKARDDKKERKSYLLEFSNIKFPAQKADVFRATLTSVNDGLVIWVESKKTKQQWQATVTDIAECGPAGFPEEAVIGFLKVF
ncbi:hypothetical protein EON63_10510 [archaeon]|nr:MAG: hypothetical protein EON63_10510 [archaeon]